MKDVNIVEININWWWVWYEIICYGFCLWFDIFVLNDLVLVCFFIFRMKWVFWEELLMFYIYCFFVDGFSGEYNGG